MIRSDKGWQQVPQRLALLKEKVEAGARRQMGVKFENAIWQSCLHYKGARDSFGGFINTHKRGE